MPQMLPMNWLLIFISINLIFMILLTQLSESLFFTKSSSKMVMSCQSWLL